VESVKFRYFFILSLILHLFVLIVFRVNIQQKAEGFRPTYVRIVELPPVPFIEKELATPLKKLTPTRPKSGSEELKGSKGLGDTFVEKRIYDPLMPFPSEPSMRSGEAGRSGGEGVKESGSEKSSEPIAPLFRDPSAKGIRGLPFITDKDLEKFARSEEPSLNKKEKSITLDTDEFKYLSYLERLKNRIEFIWKYPEVARLNSLQGDLYIRFSILKNGRLGGTHLLRSSGYKILDDAAIEALKDSDPFWPLPESWNLNELTITGHFIYYLGGIYLR
jgi:TonB family protein